MHVAPPTLEALATRYAVNVRTVKRWRKAGVDVHDPNAVADYIVDRPGQRLATLSAVCDAVREHNARQPNPIHKAYREALTRPMR